MLTQVGFFGTFILLQLISPFVSGQSTTCILPSGQQSNCVRLYLCDTFQNLNRKHAGRPPQNVIDDINRHKCPPTGNVCCPDQAVTTATTTTTTSRTTLAPPLNLEKIVDYEALKNHPNLNLVNSDKCGQSTADKISHGFDANVNEIPWQALLGYKTLDGIVVWACGGALITPRYVATASHCNARALTTVRLGEHNLLTERDCQDSVCADPVQDIAVEKFIKHPDFNRIKKRNDIALIRLAAAADTSRNNIETICLPTDAVNDVERVLKPKPNVNIPFTISGFGKLEDGRQTDILQMAFVPYVSNAECAVKYQAAPVVVIHKEYVCAGGRNKTDTCHGDSGGPIFALGKTKTRVMLYGVVIGGIDCTRADLVFPGIYSDIRYYLKWILDNIKP